MSSNTRHKALPSADVLKDLLRYDMSSGKIYWRRRSDRNSKRAKWFNARYAGKEAFTSVNAKGYRVGILAGTHYNAHRIIWRMATGEDPGELMIDHINQNPADNRLENLRLADASQNQQNKRQKRNGTSDYKGVGFVKRQNKWQAFIRENGIKRHLGTFDNERDAAYAYDQAAKRLHGDFAFTNQAMGVL